MKRTLSSIAAAALVMGTLAPAAFASTSASTYSDITAQYQFAAQDITNLSNSGYIHGYSDGTFRPASFVTRGQLLAYFWNVVSQGAVPQADAQVYADVAPGNWAFNYVGEGFSKGWLNQYWLGIKPGYNFNENYHASYSDAASFFVAAMEKSGTITSTNGMAPLAFAKAAGLFQGIPASEMTANPVYMDRATAAVFLSNVMAFMNGQLLPAGATVTVVPTSSNTAPGTTDQLNVSVKLADGSSYTLPSTAAISYSVDNKAGFISPVNQLVVTAAGTYNVVATVDGVQSQPVAITAYGAIANVKLSATTTSPVANGVSSDTITATAVDANGNTVGNFTGTVIMSMTGTGTSPALSTAQATDAAANSNGTYTLTFTNGVATFNVISGTTPGVTSTYTSSYTPSGSTVAQTATLNLTTAQQQATALQVTPVNKYISSNVATSTTFNVQVVDQTGNPMLSGTYPFTIAVSGPASYSGPTTGVFFGNGSTAPAPATVSVTSEQGVTGTISVTASAQGLTAGSGSTQSVIAGAAVKIAATETAGATSFAEGAGNGLSYTLTGADVNGYPTAFPTASGPFNVYVTNSSNASASNILVNGLAQGTNGVALGASQALQITDTNAGADAGTYTVAIKDASGNTWSTFQFTETATTATVLNLSSGSQYVSEAAPTTTVSAQVSDVFGNAVSTAGVPVTFTVAGSPGTGTFSGGTYTVTVDTSANGVATATLNMQPYSGETYTVQAAATGYTVKPSTIGITVEPTVASQATVTLAGPNGATIVTSSNTPTVTGTVYLKDPYGNPVNAMQTVTLAVTGGLTINGIGGGGSLASGTTLAAGAPYTVNVVGGQFTFTATPTSVGDATVSVTDTSVTPNVSGSGSILINANTQVAGFAFFNSSGQEISGSNELSVAANTPQEVWLKPVDVNGNPITSNAPATVQFLDGTTAGNAGSFRIGASDAASVSSYTVPAGTVAIPVWYVNSNAGNSGNVTSYDLSTASALVTTNFPSSSTTVMSSVYAYQAAVTFADFNGGLSAYTGTVNPQSFTVTGYTYATTTTPSAGQYTVTASGTAGVYDVTIYSTSGTLTSPPSIGYTF